MVQQALLEIVATRTGVREVTVVGRGAETARLYEAVWPAIEIINRATAAFTRAEATRPDAEGADA